MARKYIEDLSTWSLPLTDEFEEKLIEKLRSKLVKRRITLEDIDPQFSAALSKELRPILRIAVNEVIHYWATSNAMGVEETEIELPFLHGKDSDPLLVEVNARDNAYNRVLLTKIRLAMAMKKAFDYDDLDKDKAKTIISAVRELADSLEEMLR